MNDITYCADHGDCPRGEECGRSVVNAGGGSMSFAPLYKLYGSKEDYCSHYIAGRKKVRKYKKPKDSGDATQ